MLTVGHGCLVLVEVGRALNVEVGGGGDEGRDQREPGVPGAGGECEEGRDQGQGEGGSH